jgi:hypothetical protein
MRKVFLVIFMILTTILSACHEIDNTNTNASKQLEIKNIHLSTFDFSVFFVGEVHIEDTPLNEMVFGILIFDNPISTRKNLLIEDYLYHLTEAIIEDNQVSFNWTEINESFFNQDLYAVFYTKIDQTTVFYSKLFAFNLYNISLESESDFASHIVFNVSHVFLDSLEIAVDFKNYAITHVKHAKSHTIITDYNKVKIKIYLNDNVVLDTNFSVTINQKKVTFTYNLIEHSIYIQVDDPNWTPVY